MPKWPASPAFLCIFPLIHMHWKGSRAALSGIAGTKYTRVCLLKLQLIKINNSGLQLHEPHFKHSIGMCRWGDYNSTEIKFPLSKKVLLDITSWEWCLIDSNYCYFWVERYQVIFLFIALLDPFIINIFQLLIYICHVQKSSTLWRPVPHAYQPAT